MVDMTRTTPTTRRVRKPNRMRSTTRSVRRSRRPSAAAGDDDLRRTAVSSLVLGAVTPDEVKRNVAAISAKVPAGLWADLKSASLLEASVPTPA